MHKKLIQLGSSWGFIIPKPLLETMKVNPTLDEIEIIVERDEIRIKKYKKED